MTKALQQLAAEAGRDVAMDLERWVIRHFYCQELKIALRSWRRFLVLASPSTEHLYKIPPPTLLLPILPEIEELLDCMRSLDIRIEINQVAPPPPYEIYIIWLVMLNKI